jgi:2-succinyl-5-enolpyruvyl-6-hydroxy-3-cyclohexene-1-carboxylate synthase
MTDPAAAPSTRAARVLVQALARLGVRDVVLSPGSRSAPLAYALAAAALPDGERPDGAPAVSLHVRVDERAAAFLALGLARGADALGDDGQAGPRPVAVVTTSGTATANLHPAVLEAHHTGVPLVLLTADRPHELRGTGANQTTDQVGLYGGAVRFAADVPAPSGRAGEDRDLRHLVARAVAAARGARTGDPGPVHLDLAYREPLAPGPDDEAWPDPVDDGLVSVLVRGAGGPGTVGTLPAGAASHLAASAAAALVAAPDDGTAADDVVPTVVVAGDGAGPVARRIAEVNGWPLLAEPSSGALGGPHGIPAYRLLLGAAALGGAVRRAVVLGRPTLSRPVQALLARDDVEVLVVAPRGATWPDAARRASAVLADVPPRLVGEQDGVPVTPVSRPGEWLERWRSAGAAASSAVDRVLDAAPRGRRSRSGPRLSGPQVARLVAAACRPADVLVVGSSNPVRDLDLVGTWTDGAPVVLANRGLAGIDGTVSTALGVALAARELGGTGHVRALLGDLTSAGCCRVRSSRARTCRSSSPTTTAGRSSPRSSTARPSTRTCSSGSSPRRTARTWRRSARGTACGTRSPGTPASSRPRSRRRVRASAWWRSRWTAHGVGSCRSRSAPRWPAPWPRPSPATRVDPRLGR